MVLIGTICICSFISKSSLKAYATGNNPYFTVETSELENGTTIGNYYVPDDNNEYYGLTVSLYNNPGFGGYGIRITYNGDCYEPICRDYVNEKPVYINGDVSQISQPVVVADLVLNFLTFTAGGTTLNQIVSGHVLFVPEIADVNHDNIISMDDVSDLLDYYSYCLSHPGYNDNYIGVTFSVTYLVYDTNP